MTQEQELHLRRMQEFFHTAISQKYKVGAKEHGGSMWEYSDLKLLDEAMKECLDQWAYLFTLRENMLKRL